MMQVVHQSATEVTYDKPDHCPDNRFQCWIHAARL